MGIDMSPSCPKFGSVSTRTWDAYSGTFPNMGNSTVDGLARALRALVAERDVGTSLKDLEAATAAAADARKNRGQGLEKVGKSTIGRTLDGETAIGIDGLASLAAVFDMRPWQLLKLADSPGKGSDSEPPELQNLSAMAQDSIRRIIQAVDKANGKLDVFLEQIADLAERRPPELSPEKVNKLSAEQAALILAANSVGGQVPSAQAGTIGSLIWSLAAKNLPEPGDKKKPKANINELLADVPAKKPKRGPMA